MDIFRFTSKLFYHWRQLENVIFEEFLANHKLFANKELLWKLSRFEGIVNLLIFYVSHKIFDDPVWEYLWEVIFHLMNLHIFYVKCENMRLNNFEIDLCFKFVSITVIEKQFYFFWVVQALFNFLNCYRSQVVSSIDGQFWRNVLWNDVLLVVLNQKGNLA